MLTVLITGQSVRSLRAKEGLPLLNQITGWVLLGTPVLLTLNQRSLLTRHTSCSHFFTRSILRK